MSDLKPYQFEPKRSQPKQGQLQCDRDRSPVRIGVTLIVGGWTTRLGASVDTAINKFLTPKV